jgi:hypothetical protein
MRGVRTVIVTTPPGAASGHRVPRGTMRELMDPRQLTVLRTIWRVPDDLWTRIAARPA